MNLFPYQEQGVLFVGERKRAYLAMDMGLGKTLTSLAAAHRFGWKHILLVAEKNEIVNSENFRKEVETYFPDLTYKSLRDVTLAVLATETGFGRRVVCGINPDGLKKHDSKVIAALFDTMIVDESTFAKNTATIRFKLVHKIAMGMEYLSLLSGTPMLNGAAEIYAPLVFLDHTMVAGKGKEGKKAFEVVFAGGHKRKIRNTGKWFQDYIWWAGGANHVRELRWLIRDHFFFKQKGETGLFKKKVRTTEYVPMSLQWLGEYEQAWVTYYEKAKKRDVDLENVNDLRNLIENGQMYQVNSRWKARRVVKDIAAGMYKGRIVVFSMFVETDKIIQEGLAHHGITFKTFEEVKEWKEGTERVLVGRIKAHGKGGNVPEASTTLFVDMSFVPSQNIQAENRIDRPEQQNDMLVVYYLTEGADVIDAHVRNINRDKARKIDEFMRPITPEEEAEMPRMLAELRGKFPKEYKILGI